MVLFGKKNKARFENIENIALCLGGGGTRGFAHIGVLKALKEHNISFNFVIGTSVGSLIASLYAADVPLEEILQQAAEIKMKEIHNSFPIPNNPIKIEKVVKKIIGDVYFSDLKRKLVVVATDLKTSTECILETGNVARAVSASCCVPVLFKPVVIGDKHLVDGGLLNNIPADIARMLGKYKVITVDINPTRGKGTDSLGVFAVMKATFNIITANASEKGIINSDLIIAPDLSKYSPYDKKGFMEMIDIGYNATILQIEDIKKLILSNS